MYSKWIILLVCREGREPPASFLFSYLTEPIRDPIAISDELELRPLEIGEIIVSGWHVNTFQVLNKITGDKPFSLLHFGF